MWLSNERCLGGVCRKRFKWLMCKQFSEMSLLKFWGLSIRTHIFPRGVLFLFFACSSFYLCFSGDLVEGKGWVLFFKPQRLCKSTIPPLPSPSSQPPSLKTYHPPSCHTNLEWGSKQCLKENEGEREDEGQWQPFSSTGGEKEITPKTVFFDLVSFLVINLCLWCILFLFLYSF